MNELQVFNSKEFGDIRTTEIDGKPYFVANDVARALGYKRPADAVTAHCKGSVKHRYLTDGGEQELKVIPEGDIYRLTVRSKLPSAEKFEKWVFDEVIPSIHQYGAYMTEQTIEKALASPDFLIQLATKLKDEQTRRKEAEAEIRVKDQIIGELKPKADYYDEILKNPGLVTITQIAKDYGMSGKKMNRILHELGIQYKQSEQWLLYSDYHCLGYTQSEVTDIIRSDGTPDVKLLTKWTMKGRLFLYNKLKEKGIIPVIEQGN
jgi:prophage antirepressor-like protein|nr:MAG: antirepressor protein KilAC domain protein [Bacteriophage sp.]UVY17285.1 MAG: antirepressor protein KilAC domain [Bacteriophage sp.]UWD54657.1 MAG: antirepressor protein KilAC domain [Bacteriophage sp.]